MNEQFKGLDFDKLTLTTFLCLFKGTFDCHLEKLEWSLVQLTWVGFESQWQRILLLKVNDNKSFFTHLRTPFSSQWASGNPRPLCSDDPWPASPRTEACGFTHSVAHAHAEVAPTRHQGGVRHFSNPHLKSKVLTLNKSHKCHPAASPNCALAQSTVHFKSNEDRQECIEESFPQEIFCHC